MKHSYSGKKNHSFSGIITHRDAGLKKKKKKEAAQITKLVLHKNKTQSKQFLEK